MVFIVASSAFVGMTLYGLCARKDVGVRLSILSGAVAGGFALGFVLTQF
jgi:FtsH-binding integral membrane protein